MISDAAKSRALRARKKRLRKANRYLEGLDLPTIEGEVEERAAQHAWNGHDVATATPAISAMSGAAVGAIVAFTTGELIGGGLVVILGAFLTVVIGNHDGGRVMAEAVLKVRDSPRPSLSGKRAHGEELTS